MLTGCCQSVRPWSSLAADSCPCVVEAANRDKPPRGCYCSFAVPDSPAYTISFVWGLATSQAGSKLQPTPVARSHLIDVSLVPPHLLAGDASAERAASDAAGRARRVCEPDGGGAPHRRPGAILHAGKPPRVGTCGRGSERISKSPY
jgi:hypothetical protein